MRIDYSVQIWREGDSYIAHALPIDVVSSGMTPEAAKLAVDEAVGLFLATAKEKGTLSSVLQECGYEEFRKGGWRAPEWVSLELRSTELVA